MSVATETDLFIEQVLAVYNKQFNAEFEREEFSLRWGKPEKKDDLIRALLVTDDPTDSVKIMLAVKGFDIFTDIKPFTLGLLPNYPAGDLRDEIQMADVFLREKDFKDLRQMFASVEFQTTLNRPRNLVTRQNTRVLTQSGFSVFAQAF